MYKTQIKIFVFLFLFSCLFAVENPIRFDHISIEQGLAQSTVFSIVQDTTGFMWFATLDGLNKYDGYTFTVYRPDPSDSGSISELGIRELYLDHAGNLWIITLGGKIDRYRPRQDDFEHYVLERDSTTSGTPRAIDFSEDNTNNLWLGTTNGGLYRFDAGRNRFVAQPLTLSQSTIHLQCIYANRNNVLWIGTWEGLVRYEPSKGIITNYRHNSSNQNSLGGNIVFDLAEDGEGLLWIATANGGVSVFDREKERFEVFRHRPGQTGSLSSNRVMQVFVDNRQRVWIGTIDAGLNLFNPKTGRFEHYRHDSGDPSSFGSGAVMSIYEDNSGALWFGTSGGGVSRYDRYAQRFYHIAHNTNDPGSLSRNPVLSILEDRHGGLWVGTDGGGLNYRPSGKQSFTHLLTQPGETGSNSVTALYEDQRGIIWIGTDPGGQSPAGAVFWYDPHNHSLEPFTKIDLTMGGVATFFEDGQGDIWISTSIDGIRRYHPASGTVTTYRHEKTNPHSLNGNSIFAITEDTEGDLWFGAIHAGVSRWHRRTGTFTSYRSHPEHPDSLSNNTVWCLHADSSGDVWMGTWGGGLNVFRRRRGVFQRFTVHNGLPSNVIYGILPDGLDNLWLSTNHGLCKFDPVTFSCKNYDQTDGLQSNEFNQGAVCRGRDGRLYFGGINGITVFHPEYITENRHVPPVVLTRFRVFDKELPLPQPLGFTREITLSYRQNFFSFEFAALDYIAPEKNQYDYMLEGIDPDWVLSGNRRFASYTDISPGKYVFKVKGANNDGVWNEQPVEVVIRITPPFWQTWWFRVLILLALVAALSILHRYRLNKLLEVERTRLRIARDLHDDVSATITGIAYFSDALAREVGQQQTPAMKKLLSLMHESVANVHESLSDIIWSIKPENDKWEFILPKFRRFASELCESKDISYTIQIPETITGKTLSMERRRNLWMIFKEMVTNAVKHSECSELTISISESNNQLRVIVADNGKGFDPLTSTEGNGVKNIHSRAAALNGNVKLITKAGEGTRWELTVPV